MPKYDPKKVRRSKNSCKMRIYGTSIVGEEKLFCSEGFFSRLKKKIFPSKHSPSFLCYELLKTYKELEIKNLEKNIPVGVYPLNKGMGYFTDIEAIEKRKSVLHDYREIEILLASEKLMYHLTNYGIFSGDEVLISPILPRLNLVNPHYELKFGLPSTRTSASSSSTATTRKSSSY